MSPKEQRCENCYYSRHPSDSTYAECRRNPPLMMQPMYSNLPQYPPVTHDNWCGEWRDVAEQPSDYDELRAETDGDAA